MGEQTMTILLVEDDPADQKLVKSSLKAQKMVHDLHIANSGEEALDFLREHKNGANLPDLVLLDLNMPGIGGKEFLRLIKSDEELKRIPILVLTTSDSEKDILDSYQLQAAGYVHKPSTLDELREAMSGIDGYWFALCKLPRREYQ